MMIGDEGANGAMLRAFGQSLRKSRTPHEGEASGVPWREKCREQSAGGLLLESEAIALDREQWRRSEQSCVEGLRSGTSGCNRQKNWTKGRHVVGSPEGEKVWWGNLVLVGEGEK
jgi:hypothetical protein